MILEVPYYSQFDDAIKPEWKENACGIVSLKMVLDFYQPIEKTINDLYQEGLDINGFLENIGWYHHSLAIIAKNLGFKGITRSWNIKDEYRETLRKRGFGNDDLNLAEKQQLAEAIFTLKGEIDQKRPVIVSAARGFRVGGTGHLTVLVGYDRNNFYFNDPDDQERNGKKIKVAVKDFISSFSKRAIIIQK